MNRAREPKPDAPLKTEAALNSGPIDLNKAGGGDSGAGHPSSSGEVYTGMTSSGSGIIGTATVKIFPGAGHGSGVPGIGGYSAPIRTNREAKPVQTVRASYPPMALRMGIEGDVTFKIEVDTEGRVTRADVVKSGGMEFDEEALRAVKLARFEPAQRVWSDGGGRIHLYVPL